MDYLGGKEPTRILLIEDDLSSAEFIGVCLGAMRPKQNYRVEVAGRLGDGLEKAQMSEFDIVLLDINLPDSDGIDTLDRAREGLGETPIIVLTNRYERGFGLKAIAHGAQDFLFKTKLDTVQIWRAIRFALERSRLRRRLDAMLQGVTDGIVVIDANQKILYANGAAETYLSFSIDQSVGETFPLKLESEREEMLLSDKEGKNRSVIVRVGPVDWDAKDSRLVTMHDISEIRTLEEARAEVQSRKKHEEMKDAFLGNLFHEMRSPLTVAQSVLRILDSDESCGLDSKSRELVAAGLRNMDRLIRTVSDLLDLSRLESGRPRVRYSTFSTVEAVLEAVDDARHIKEEGMKIQVEMLGAPSSHEIFADRDMVLQLLHNLLGNAMRFSRGMVRIRLGGDSAGEQVCIDVIDDGPGIPENELTAVFDRYCQLERKGHGDYKGTGLGLPICRDLVELNHGRISVANDVEGGAKISVVFPSARACRSEFQARGVETVKKEVGV